MKWKKNTILAIFNWKGKKERLIEDEMEMEMKNSTVIDRIKRSERKLFDKI